MSKENLEKRFRKFMDNMSNVECIDNLLDKKEKRKKADYLCCNREIVVELKTIKSDPGHKADKILDKHSGRDDYPIVYGKVNINKILKHLPDGDDIKKDIYLKITRSLEDIVRKANKQIKSSKDIFNLSDSIGLLIILNDSVSIFSPEVMATRLSQLICKSNEDGSKRYPDIDFIWIIQENYEIDINGINARPLILIEGSNKEDFSKFDECFDYMQKAWVEFNNSPMFTANIGSIQDINFKEITETKPRNTITRQELWEMQYLENPYLRNLSDDDVLKHGAKIFDAMLPNFLKYRKKIQKDKLKEFMIGWADFLVEARYRGLDMKKLPINT